MPAGDLGQPCCLSIALVVAPLGFAGITPMALQRPPSVRVIMPEMFGGSSSAKPAKAALKTKKPPANPPLKKKVAAKPPAKPAPKKKVAAEPKSKPTAAPKKKVAAKPKPKP